MADIIKSFQLGTDVIDVPESKSEYFKSKYPDAKEVHSFTIEGDTIDVPVDKSEYFRTKYPGAKPLQPYNFATPTTPEMPKQLDVNMKMQDWNPETPQTSEMNTSIGGDAPIQGNSTKEETGFWSTWGGDALQALASGTARIASNIGGLANLPMRSFLNYKVKEAGVPEEARKIFVDAFLANNFNSGAAETLKISAKKEAERLNKASDRYNGKDFEQLYKEGNIGAVAGDIFLQGAKSLPYMVMAMAGGPIGLGAIGLTSMADKYDQLDNPELPPVFTEKQKADFIAQKNMGEVQKLINSALTGTSEALSEKLGSVPMGKFIGRLYSKVGSEAATEALQKGISGWVNKMFDRYGLLLGPVSEGLEEYSNQVATNTIDYVTGANTKFEPLKDAAKSFVYGMGGGMYGTAVALPGEINKWMGNNSGSAQATQTQAQPPQPPTQQSQPVNPIFQAAQTARNLFNKYANPTTGNLKIINQITDPDTPNVPWIVKSSFDDPSGKKIFFVVSPDGRNHTQFTSEQVSETLEGNPMEITGDEWMAQQRSLFEQEQQAVNDQMTINGITVTRDPLAQPIDGVEYWNDENNNPVEVTQEQVKAFEQAKQSGLSPNVVTYTYGKTEVTGTENEDGSIEVAEPMPTAAVQSFQKEVEASTGGKSTLKTEVVPQENNMPDLFKVSIVSKQEGVEPVADPVAEPTPQEITYTYNGNPIDQRTAKARVNVAIRDKNKSKLDGLLINNDPELTALIDKAFPPPPAPKAKFTFNGKAVKVEDAMDHILASDNIQELQQLKHENIDQEPEVKAAYDAKVKEFTPIQVKPTELAPPPPNLLNDGSGKITEIGNNTEAKPVKEQANKQAKSGLSKEELIDLIDAGDNPKTIEKYTSLLNDEYGVEYVEPKVRYANENAIVQGISGTKNVTTAKGLAITLDIHPTKGLDRSATIDIYSENGEKIGSTGFNIDQENKSIKIGGAQVADSHRRKGVYTEVFNEIEQIAKNNGLTIIDSGKSDSAKKFHENRGEQKRQEIKNPIPETQPIQADPKVAEIQASLNNAGLITTELNGKFYVKTPLNAVIGIGSSLQEAHDKAKVSKPELFVAPSQSDPEPVKSSANSTVNQTVVNAEAVNNGEYLQESNPLQPVTVSNDGEVRGKLGENENPLNVDTPVGNMDTSGKNVDTSGKNVDTSNTPPTGEQPVVDIPAENAGDVSAQIAQDLQKNGLEAVPYKDSKGNSKVKIVNTAKQNSILSVGNSVQEAYDRAKEVSPELFGSTEVFSEAPKEEVNLVLHPEKRASEIAKQEQAKADADKAQVKLEIPDKSTPLLDVLAEGKRTNADNQEVKKMVDASSNLPQTVRELADLDAGTQDGLLSAAVFSALEQGDVIKLGRDKTVTVTRKTKPTKQSYSIDKKGKAISGNYNKVSLTLTDNKGNKYSGELWLDWYSDGRKMVSRWAGRGQTRKSDPWGQLSREIEGDISVDLINEYNRFHDVSDSFKLVKKYLDKFNAEQISKNKSEEKKDHSVEPNETIKQLETREQFEAKLLEERKQRILNEGSGIDKEFGLIQPKNINSADDIISNIDKILSILKSNEGNGKYKSFEGFASNGNYTKNAGEQVREYFYALDVLPNEIRKSFASKINANTHEELSNWARKRYEDINQNPIGDVLNESTKEAEGQAREENLLTYSDKRYNSTINVGEKYYDNRYGDYYTIESMVPFGETDVEATLKYDKGTTRKEKGSFLLYHIDAKQHSLKVSDLPSVETGKKPGEETPPVSATLSAKLDDILANSSTSRKHADVTELIYHATNIEGLKSLLDHPYVKRDMDLPKEVYSRIQYLERHPEKQDKQAESQTSDKSLTEILKDLSNKNKSTTPKIPTENIFKNSVSEVPKGSRNEVDKLIEAGKENEIPIQKVNVSDIIPTQKNLTIDNIKSTNKVDELPILLKSGDKYFILDGHHRISNRILEGNKDIEAHVFDSEAKREIPLNEIGEPAPAKEIKAKIEDFGEKLLGAKKDRLRDIAKSAKDATIENLIANPLSKVFPEPDYKKMIDEGQITSSQASAIKILREQIPAKPKKAYRVKAWAESAKEFINLIDGLVNKSGYFDVKNGKTFDDFSNKYSLISPREGQRMAMKKRFYDFAGTDLNASSYDFYKNSNGEYGIVFGDRIKGRFKTEQEAFEGLKNILEESKGKPKETNYKVYQDQRTGDIFIGYKAGTNVVRLKQGFDDFKLAHEYLKANKPEIDGILDKLKDIPSERKATNSPRLGTDYRNGKDISPKQFTDTFGFRGTQFGNYVENIRRVQDLNEAYDALMDLSNVLNLPPKAISLNGELGLAFGARGSGKAMAHYEPGQVVINLTKTKGAGSLAHEWFHAVDNYFERADSHKGAFVTDSARQRHSRLIKDPSFSTTRPEVLDAFAKVNEAISKTGLYKRSSVLDNARTKDYWGTGIEMNARAFEWYIKNRIETQGGQNDFLANIESQKSWDAMNDMFGVRKDSYPYPTEVEAKTIVDAFDNLFKVIETKEDNGNSVMFSKASTIGFYSTVENSLEKIQQNKGTVDQFRAMLLKNGAKQAELDWMGFDDQFEDKLAMVTKGQIQDWIDQNKIEVEEVVKGGYLLDKEQFKRELESQTEDELFDLAEEIGVIIPMPHEADKEEIIRQILYQTINTDTKFSQYVEPGGDNYKEVLLTMPKKTPVNFRDYLKEYKAAYPKSLADDVEIREYFDKGHPINNINHNSFKSSHFDEPNILAHIRFNERTVNGEKVLFVEEFQSDWAQKGKKEGFVNPREKLKYNDKNTHIELDAQAKEYVLKTGTEIGSGHILAGAFEFNLEKKTEKEKHEFLINQANGVYSRNNRPLVPNMPFSKTDQWVNLAFRRMMKYAVDNGFDRIAWTNGEQQAARYDLSKQVDAIRYDKSSNGTYEIRADIENREVLRRNRVAESELEGIVGKEVAQKIINGEGKEPERGSGNYHKTLSGVDLKVGGEGMKAFYDAIIPSAANKLGKPFGARVENTDLLFGTKGEVDTNPLNITAERYDGSQKDFIGSDYAEIGDHIIRKDWQEVFAMPKSDASTEQQAIDAYYKLLEEEEGYKIPRSEGVKTVQSIPVTNSMRESIPNGQPMFSLIGQRGAANIENIVDNLTTAKEMTEAGKDKQTIFLATGWEKFPDGWKYDLPDGELLKTFDEILNLEAKNEYFTEDIPLNELLSSNDLFNAYPELKEYKVRFYNYDTPIEGQQKDAYSSSEGKIFGIGIGVRDNVPLSTIFSRSSQPFGASRKGGAYDRDSVLGLLLHETQHIIQGLENFGRGSNAEDSWGAAVKKKMEEHRKNGWYEDQSDAIKTQLAEDAVLKDENSGVKKTAGFKLYKRAAGEVEARNVQSRLNLSPEERKQQLISATEDVSEDQKIYLVDAIGKAFSDGGTQSAEDIIKMTNDASNTQDDIVIMNGLDVTADLTQRGIRLDKDIIDNLQTDNWHGVTINGKIYIHSSITNQDRAVQVTIHEKAHVYYYNIFDRSQREYFFERIYDELGENEIKRILPSNYWGLSKATQAEEYVSHTAEKLTRRIQQSPNTPVDQLLEEILTKIPNNEVKDVILDSINDIIDLKKLQDVTNTYRRANSDNRRKLTSQKEQGFSDKINSSGSLLDPGTKGNVSFSSKGMGQESSSPSNDGNRTEINKVIKDKSKPLIDFLAEAKQSLSLAKSEGMDKNAKILTVNINEDLLKRRGDKLSQSGTEATSRKGRITDADVLGRDISHEVQHIIQSIEGFEFGGSSQDAQRLFPEQVFGGNINNDVLEGGTSTENDVLLRKKSISEKSHEIYTRFSGEVEARNVETRLNLTPEQRRNTLLKDTEDVSREDQIILFDGLGAAKSIPLLERLNNAKKTPTFDVNHINVAYGSVEKFRKAVNATSDKAVQLRLFDNVPYSGNEDGGNLGGNESERMQPGDNNRGRGGIREWLGANQNENFNNPILSRIRKRTVISDFKESGEAKFIGTKITSPQDIADLWSIHRSPYIEKGHVIFLKDEVIVGSTATTLNRAGQTAFASTEEIIRLAKSYGADSIYILHNHPSGNHNPSIEDVEVSSKIHSRLLMEGIDMKGSIVIDHNKFSLMDFNESPVLRSFEHYLNNNVQELDYKNAVPKLFHERQKINGYEDLIDISKALLNEADYKGAIIYLSPNNHITGYDIFPEGATEQDIINIASEALGNNVGARVAFIHDGSYDFHKTPVPHSTIDVVNVATLDTNQYDKTLDRPTPNTQTMWEPLSDYLKKAGERYGERRELKRTWGEIAEGIRKSMQDSDLSVRRLQEKVKELGGSLGDLSKPYQQLSRAFGRMETLYTDFTKGKIDPIWKTMGKIRKAGMPTEVILPYVIAKHSLERNPKMRTDELQKWIESHPNASQKEIDAFEEMINVKDFSGVKPLDDRQQALDKEFAQWQKDNPIATEGEKLIRYKELVAIHNPRTADETAQKIVDEFESEVSPDLVTELWDNIREATSHTVDTWYKGAQISKVERDAMLAEYKYFVPLRSWRDGDPNALHTAGEGFSKSLQHAEGRGSLADNPIAYLQKVGLQAISEQVNQESRKQLLNLVVQNYDDRFQNLYKIKKAYYVKTTMDDGSEGWELSVDANGDIVKPTEEQFKNGEARYTLFSLHQKYKPRAQSMEHEVIVHSQNGDIAIIMLGEFQEVAYAMNHRNKMARYLLTGKPFDADFWNKPLSNTLGRLNNWYKSMMTQWNVVFPTKNIFRDVPEAALTQWIQGENGAGVVANIYHSIPAIMKALVKGDYSGKYGDYYKEFKEAGGTTGYTHQMTAEQIEEKLNKHLKRMMSEGTFKNKALNLPRKAKEGIASWNMIFEDATRLSVFITARESGHTINDSVTMAKEASVNFDRNGKLSPAFDAWFAFYNASVQGAQKNVSLFKNYPKRAALVGLSFVALGVLEAMMNDSLPGDDDDDYFNISQYMRENYLILPNFLKMILQAANGEPISKGDQYLSIPLPMFWRSFKSLGSLIYDLSQDRITPKELAVRATGNFFTSLTPVDIAAPFTDDGSWYTPFVPTFFKPAVELAENRNYMGFRIAMEPFTQEQKKELANSGLGKENVNDAIKFFTDALFRAGGGDNETKFYTDEDGNRQVVKEIYDWNPSKIEHLIVALTAGTGKMIMDTGKSIIKAINPNEEIDFKDLPFVNSFIRKTPEAKWKIIKEFYGLKKEIEGIDVLKRAYYKKGSYDKYVQLSTNGYYAQYEGIVTGLDDAVQNLMKTMDFKTASGSDQVLGLMKTTIDQVKQLKLNYKR